MWPSDEQYFATNLKLLAVHQPEQAELLKVVGRSFKEKVEAFTTPQGLGLAWEGRALNSRFKPQEEAQAFVSSSYQEEDGPPLVFGLGAGYHVPYLVQAYDFFWLAEPRPEIARAALTISDYSDYFKYKAKFKFIFNQRLEEEPWPVFLINHVASSRLSPAEYQYWKAFLGWPKGEAAANDLAPWPELQALVADHHKPISPWLVWNESSKNS